MKKIVYGLLSIALSLVTLNAKSYKYDDLDRVIEVAYESGEKIYYSYDSAGNMLDVRYALELEVYHLNSAKVTDPNIIAKIKEAIKELEEIKDEVHGFVVYDTLKQKLDGAKSKIDAIKQAIDNHIADNAEKIALKVEADSIKSAIDDIKSLVDGYKSSSDTSVQAIDDIKSDIDAVIDMMVRGGSSSSADKSYIDVPKGRSVISGNIDATKLPSEIYAVWIVDGGNWYGYSPKQSIRDAIKAKYRLIDKIIPAYKAVIVWADEDASIELEDDNSIENVTQSYGKNFTIHGANNQNFSVDDVVCSDTNNSITGLFKVSGDIPSVFVPNREINSTENFTYIYSDEGYYVLCEQKLGGSR